MDIVLFPDKGEFKDWKVKADAMRKDGLRISVSRLIEDTDKGKGFDLADYYLQQRELEFNRDDSRTGE